MKAQINKLMMTAIGIQFLFSTSFLYAADKKAKVPVAAKINSSCLQDKKNEFKVLYLKLQQSLNYEGKDVQITNPKTGAFVLVPHKGEEYEGKIFEKKLFKEYQNSLRKVGAIYQAAKFDAANNPADFNSNTALVDFIKAVDGGDGAKYISGTNIDSVIEQLQKASESKYPADSKLRISANDKYLLKKLLTHAQDRLCSINEYIRTKKGTKFFSAEEMEKKKNAPLNQLLLAVKDAKLTKDSDIQVVDTDVAINSAIQENINALSKWIKEASAGCKAAVASNAFMNSIQTGIQSCNYGEFVKSLETANTTDIEKILHFINSNEKFLKKAAPKAETDMDEFKLQAYVDRTFTNLGNKIHCSEVVNTNKDGKRLFVRNLPYLDAQNKFDTSKISCKVKVAASKKGPASERVLNEQECAGKIELVSDDLGRGIEVKQKNPKEAPISFSIKDNPECNDIALVVPQEEVKPDPVTVNPPVVSGAVIWTLQMCVDKGLADKFPGEATLEKDGTCKFTATDAECNKQKAGQIANPEKTGCIDRPEVKPEVVKKTKEECDKLDKDLDEKINECVPRTKVEPPKKEEPTESDAEKECRVKNEKLAADNDGRPTEQWKVNKDGKCVDSKFKPSKSKDTEFEEAEKPVRTNDGSFKAPGRFTPINIPTRQMYILPGMP